ncbi:MAG: hypothetical protein ABR582_17475, partial [Gemmatimonadaceae bacterium]
MSFVFFVVNFRNFGMQNIPRKRQFELGRLRSNDKVMKWLGFCPLLFWVSALFATTNPLGDQS